MKNTWTKTLSLSRWVLPLFLLTVFVHSKPGPASPRPPAQATQPMNSLMKSGTGSYGCTQNDIAHYTARRRPA